MGQPDGKKIMQVCSLLRLTKEIWNNESRKGQRETFSLDCAVFARILQKELKLAGVSLTRKVL